MPDKPILRFRFIGGDADANRIDFYDAGRFLYGAARFVYGVEHYRQKKRVIKKLSTKINVDLQVRGAQPGSSIWEIVSLATPLLVDCAVKVPLEALISHYFGKLFNSKKKTDETLAALKELTRQKNAEAAAEIARQEANMETQRNMGRLIGIIEGMVAGERNPATKHRLSEMNATLAADQRRRVLLRPHQAELAEIPEADIDSLLQRQHAAIQDIGRPTMRSAEKLEIYDVANDNQRPIFSLGRSEFVSISGDKVDDVPIPIRGIIKRYDKEMGWGQFRNEEIGVVGFQIPSARKNEQLLAILDSMKQDEVYVSFYFVRSRLGAIKYLIFDNLLDDDADE